MDESRLDDIEREWEAFVGEPYDNIRELISEVRTLQTALKTICTDRGGTFAAEVARDALSPESRHR